MGTRKVFLRTSLKWDVPVERCGVARDGGEVVSFEIGRQANIWIERTMLTSVRSERTDCEGEEGRFETSVDCIDIESQTGTHGNVHL